VLGVERFDIPHDLGSSGGRDADHPARVLRALVVRAAAGARSYELWRELEAEAGERLLRDHGSVDASEEDGRIFTGSLASLRRARPSARGADGRGAWRRRFPGYRLPSGTMAVLQPEGGFLLPERCIVAHVELAQAAGAEVRARERVVAWEPSGDGVRVRTDRGEYMADRLVLAGGAWMSELMRLPFVQAERQVLGWFQPLRPELFAPERFPVFNLELEDGHFYGFPVYGIPGFKLGRYHHLGEEVDADSVDRTPRPDDEAVLRSFAERYFPDAAGPAMTLKACLFENTPDEHFIVDLHPDAPGVVCLGGGSGHGFKFCSVLGEIAADLAIQGTTRHDISLLRLGRFEHPGL
jgi:sarcosine oxidase